MAVEPDKDQSVVANEAKAIAKKYMREGQSFVWNATNLNQKLRGMRIRLFSSYQARVRVVYLEAFWEELLQRNRSRFAQVSEKVLYRMKNRLDVPNTTEA